MPYHASYAVIDLETTGIGPADRVIEIGVVLLDKHLEFKNPRKTKISRHRN